MIPMSLVGVRVEVPSNVPIVLLREIEGQRHLPIYIGQPEATAIVYALQGLDTPRPMTHDLFIQALTELGVGVTQVVITELHSDPPGSPGTFYAEIELVHGAGTHRISTRPSDAIALAVRVSAPLFASEELLDEVGQDPTPEPEEEAEEILDEFRDFIEHVNPDDFAG